MDNIEVKIKGGSTWLFTTIQEAAYGLLKLIPEKEREVIFGRFCASCGRENPVCQCSNDE